jgi:hypothetical protein
MVADVDRQPIDVVVAEYLEMPGLALTKPQACRLWNLDEQSCERLLEELVRTRFLKKLTPALYVRADILH